MKKGWSLFIKPYVRQSQVIEAVEKLMQEDRRELNKTYYYPKQMTERIAPGQVARALRKENERSTDRERVKEIVSAIFKQKKIRYPHTNLKDARKAEPESNDLD